MEHKGEIIICPECGKPEYKHEMKWLNEDRTKICRTCFISKYGEDYRYFVGNFTPDDVPTRKEYDSQFGLISSLSNKDFNKCTRSLIHEVEELWGRTDVKVFREKSINNTYLNYIVFQNLPFVIKYYIDVPELYISGKSERGATQLYPVSDLNKMFDICNKWGSELKEK